MSQIKISQLPEYTGSTTGVYLVMDNASQTATYKVTRENIIGASGTSGTSGTSGSSGVNGNNGSSGTSGTSGQNGSSGTSGGTGSSGTSGQNGSSGTSGQAGSSGTSGTSGGTGSNGTSGTSGTSPSITGFITTGSLAQVQSITGSLTISEGEIITGSLTNIGDHYMLNQAYNSTSVKLNITSSNPVTSSNLIFGPAAPLPINVTGSFVITGSNNIITNPARVDTIVTGGSYGYINGGGNIVSAIPTLNTGSTVRPQINNNLIYSIPALQFITPVGTPSFSQNLFNGNTTFAHQSGSVTVSSNYIGQTLTSTANTTNLAASPTISNNVLIGSATSLNHNSSSILYQNNLGGGVTLNNNYSSSVSTAVNNINVQFNLLGGSANTITVTGSNLSSRRSVYYNTILGYGNTINSTQSGSNYFVASTHMLGSNLIISGSNTSQTGGGSVFVGRYNATGSNLEGSEEVVFAVGTGTGAGARRTGLLIDSGSNITMSGSVNINGNINATNSGGTLSGSFRFKQQSAGAYPLIAEGQSAGQTALLVSGSQLITGSLQVVGNTTVTGSVGMSGSVGITGSLGINGPVQGNSTDLTIASNTASLDLNSGSFFSLQLVSGSETHILPTNLKGNVTLNVIVNTTGSAQVTFPTSIRQPSGSIYIPTATTGVDVLSLVSNNAGTQLYLVSAKNFI